MGTDRKRRHHYVWQYYLSAWATDEAVICRRDGKVFRTGTRVLGVETDLYRLKEPTDAELEFIRRLCFNENTNSYLRELNAGWLPVFLGPFALRALAESLPKQSPEVMEALALAESNNEENLHMGIEAESIPYIDALRGGDLTFLTAAEDRGRFLHYLCVQYFRTPKMRHLMTAALDGLHEVRTDHVIGLLRHVFATNVAWGLLNRWDQTAVTLLTAPSGHEFITSDQPVVNLHAVGTEMFEPVEKLALYYPVSPSEALLWNAEAGEGGIAKRSITAAELISLNRDFASLAHQQVFARSQETLDPISE